MSPETVWFDWLASSHPVGKMPLCLCDAAQIGTRSPDYSVLQQRQKTVLHNRVSLDSDVRFSFQNWWQRYAHFQVTLTWFGLLALPHSSYAIWAINICSLSLGVLIHKMGELISALEEGREHLVKSWILSIGWQVGNSQWAGIYITIGSPWMKRSALWCSPIS